MFARLEKLLHKFFSDEILSTIARTTLSVKRTFAVMIGCALCLYLFLLLLSYHPDDPAWSHLSTQMLYGEVHNIGGVWGAYVADTLRTIFGLGAWAVLVWLAYEIYLAYGEHARSVAAVRLVAYLLMWACVCMVLFGITADSGKGLYFGGVIGHELYWGLTQLVGTWLAIIFALLMITVIGWLMFERLNFAETSKRSGARALLKNLLQKHHASHSTQARSEHNYQEYSYQDQDTRNRPHQFRGTLESFLVHSGLRAQLHDTKALTNIELAKSITIQKTPTNTSTQRSSTDAQERTQNARHALDTPSIAPRWTEPSHRQERTAQIVESDLLSISGTHVSGLQGAPNDYDSNNGDNGDNDWTARQDALVRANADVGAQIHAHSQTVWDGIDFERLNDLKSDTQTPNAQMPLPQPKTLDSSPSFDPRAFDANVADDHLAQNNFIQGYSSQDDQDGSVQDDRIFDFDLDTAPLADRGLHQATDRTVQDDQCAVYAHFDEPFVGEISRQADLHERANIFDIDINDRIDDGDIAHADEIALGDTASTKPIPPAIHEHKVNQADRDSTSPLDDSSADLGADAHDVPAMTQALNNLEASRIATVSTPALLASALTQAVTKPSVHITPNLSPSTHDDMQSTNKSVAFTAAAHRASLPPLPSIDILDQPDPDRQPSYSPAQLQQMSELLEIKLQEFRIKASVMNATQGPVVTLFEVDLAPGIKASKVTGIASDLARSLRMDSCRVIEVLPGKSYIGIEVPNKKRTTVRLIELLRDPSYTQEGTLNMAMGTSISGKVVISDLAKAPHMLVAGTTGSGKSVLMNSIMLSLLFRHTPDELRLVLIDPKQVELANYSDIPHLLSPVITDMTEATTALAWCVEEMERRYKLLATFRMRHINDLNVHIKQADAKGQSVLDPLWNKLNSVSDTVPKLKPLPYIVVIADEFADLMMQVGKQAEELIARLAQKARACGIHLILATQRPSANVVTGLIKTNIPARAALKVSSGMDSRIILDEMGAENMLGDGDMLFIDAKRRSPERVHGAFVSDQEVNRVCDTWRERGRPDYVDMAASTTLDIDVLTGMTRGGGSGSEDALYADAVRFVTESGKTSISALQRGLGIGYNRSANLVEALEQNGVLSAPDRSGKRSLISGAD